ncbi:MAG: type I phosphomannose isomerase catalytic subunit [Lutibacter sp.]|nr:mannose-6-phosphate isomerase [Lutibacter sp.]MDT8418257.1 type I phosphomannose isomerase catalytic subunit [Lutibacter sp.]
MLNYPIKFYPILKEKIWGGTKLVTKLNKKSASKNVGESWELSDVEDNVSVVSNGKLKGKTLQELLETYKAELIGENNYAHFGNNFPLLIKFIDAKEDLSVQVHPNDELAKKLHNSFGKTEMWYITQADSGSKLIVGFNKEITPDQYLNYVAEKKIPSILNYENVKAGDAFFIEPGTVHTIGAGILLAEIQQTSDITYRIYDWGRVDDQGNPRVLHTDLAVEAINFSHKIDAKRNYSTFINSLNTIVKCEYFTTNFIHVVGEKELDYAQIDSFVVFMCVQGKATISMGTHTETLNYGETVLIPASAETVIITSKNCKLLEVTV